MLAELFKSVSDGRLDQVAGVELAELFMSVEAEEARGREVDRLSRREPSSTSIMIA